MIRLTELEERLAAADGDVLRNELAARLQQTALQLKTRLARPLPRDDFVATNACLQAALAAQAVLDTWTTGLGPVSPPPPAARLHIASGLLTRNQENFDVNYHYHYHYPYRYLTFTEIR